MSYIPEAEPRPSQSPAPADALPSSAPLQDTPAHPQDRKEHLNFLDLGNLSNFTAHGVRPSLLLYNLDKDRLSHWLTIPNAILVLPLDAKYNATAAQSFRNNLEEHLSRAFPSSAATIEVHPPAQQSSQDPKETRPWGSLIQGLSPLQANTLVRHHLWLSQSIGFIAISLLTFDPTSYVISLKDMAVNLNEANEVITAVTLQMTTPKRPPHDTLKELGVPPQTIMNMVNECRAIPRGYSTDKKETLKGIKEKRNPTSNNTITLWEVHIPPPFTAIQDTSPGTLTQHDVWINSFKNTVFKSLKSAKGSALPTNRNCFTCKAIDHTYPLCPIHEHHAWRLQHPEYEEAVSNEDEPDDNPPSFRPTRGRRSSRPPRRGRGSIRA